jgi:histidine triad (HIT) family protein
VADCIFCRIVAGDIPARLLHSDDAVVAFADGSPQAPTHVLVVPRAHHGSLGAIPPGEEAILGRLLGTCRDLAVRLGLGGGYRVVINTGRDGGQTVDHLHVHLLGGRAMTWPPG